MTLQERKRFMFELEKVKDQFISVKDVIAEMDKLQRWKQKYHSRSIERAYCAAHEEALRCLINQAKGKMK